MSDPFQKSAVSPLARLRLSRTDRHDARVVFDIQGAIVVLDHSLFAQSPWGQLWPASQQAILVRNPDAWRLRVLSGPLAERGGIASGEWVLDSGLRLEWAEWALTLEVLEPGFERTAALDSAAPPLQNENDSRSGLYKLASSLAAAQLRLDQQSDKQKQRDSAFVRQRKKLGLALTKRLHQLKHAEARLTQAKNTLDQDQARGAALQEEITSQRNQLANVTRVQHHRERRIQTLRRKALARWREHIQSATGLLRQNQSLIAEKLTATQAIVDQLARRESELLQAEAELAQARTKLDADTFARNQEHLAHHGDWLLKQGELNHHEERLRAESRILGELGAPLREALGKLGSNDSQSIVQLLQERITAISAEPVRAVGLDSWEKRIELWAASISEREMAVSHREQELLRLVAEYREIRERREAELSASFQEQYQKTILQVAQMPSSTGDLASGTVPDILSFPSGGSSSVTDMGSSSTLGHSGSLAGPKSKLRKLHPPIFRGNQAPQETMTKDANQKATLIRRETDLAERARRLAEEAVVLERYRMRLLGASENPERSKEEIRSLKSQLRKRMGLEELTLKAAKKELSGLFKRLKRRGAKLSRRAEAIARERLNQEEQATQEWAMDLLLAKDERRQKAA